MAINSARTVQPDKPESAQPLRPPPAASQNLRFAELLAALTCNMTYIAAQTGKFDRISGAVVIATLLSAVVPDMLAGVGFVAVGFWAAELHRVVFLLTVLNILRRELSQRAGESSRAEAVASHESAAAAPAGEDHKPPAEPSPANAAPPTGDIPSAAGLSIDN